jgi:hypothetical protein
VQHAKFSLAGLTASLVWIDEQQKRLGSERVASAPPYGLSPTGGEQTQTPQVPIALLDRMAADPDCQPFENLANGRDIYTGKLDEGHTVYVLPCWSAAYNFGWKVFVGQLNSFDPVYFADFDGTLGWVGTATLINVSYDDNNKELRSLSKGRGIGDCGSAGRWRWKDYAFQMVEFRAKDACDEQLDDWPIIYPAQP